MASYETRQLILANPPTGMPVLSGPDATFKLQTVTLPELKPGELLCKVQYFSSDAGQRGFIQSTVSDDRLYVPPVHAGTPMRSGVIAEVLESKSDKIKVGDQVMDYHMGNWADKCILSDATSQKLDPLPGGLLVTHFLGAFGGSGLTAYTGLLYAGNAKRDSDQTIVVSAAGGATGSMAIQIAAKLFKVKRVVGIAGSDEKCAWVKKIGAHACVNYKSPTFARDLAEATPDEVDVYFDNVGGPVLDAMLPRMKRLGRGTVAVCGAIGQYNADGRPMELHNWCEVFSARIAIKGFIMLDYLEHVPAGLQELVAAAADGRLDLSDAETLVEAPLEKQPEVWSRLYTGDNRGKLVTKLVG
ncbi:NAD(P)-binding protein [Xylariomycetidae sp. FL2044]|nr:NAD(P)-binding protein [Xylariomycetidae sp. FL2044]